MKPPLNEKILTVVYGLSTLAFIGLIGTMMVLKSGYWFLALYLWHWRWSKTMTDIL